MMNLKVNGKPHKHGGKATVKALLDEMKIKHGSVAVMVNDQVINRRKFSSHELCDGDHVEILAFVGGG